MEGTQSESACEQGAEDIRLFGPKKVVAENRIMLRFINFTLDQIFRFEQQSLDRWILKWILQKHSGKVWTGYLWLIIGVSGVLM